VDSTDANITNSTNSNGMVQENALEAALSLQAKSVIAQAGATQLSGFAGDVKLPTMPGNSVVSDGGNGDANEGDAIGVGTSAFQTVTLKPTRFAGAVDVSKHLMYSATGQLDDLFGRDLGNAIAAKFDEHVLAAVRSRLQAADRHSTGRSNGTNTAGLATDFSDVARLMGVYLAGNPDDLNRAFFLAPEIYGHLLGQTADAGGMIQAAAGEQLLGHPAFVTTNVKNASFETLEYFGDTDTADTVTASPIMCVDASDIFMCTWAGLSINVDVYTEALKGVVRVIADGYMDGNIRRVGSGAIAAGLAQDTTY
jgi:HK97 family phage major capsid protein